MIHTLKKLISLLIILSFSCQSIGVDYTLYALRYPLSEDTLRPVAAAKSTVKTLSAGINLRDIILSVIHQRRWPNEIKIEVDEGILVEDKVVHIGQAILELIKNAIDGTRVFKKLYNDDTASPIYIRANIINDGRVRVSVINTGYFPIDKLREQAKQVGVWKLYPEQDSTRWNYSYIVTPNEPMPFYRLSDSQIDNLDDSVLLFDIRGLTLRTEENLQRIGMSTSDLLGGAGLGLKKTAKILRDAGQVIDYDEKNKDGEPTVIFSFTLPLSGDNARLLSEGATLSLDINNNTTGKTSPTGKQKSSLREEWKEPTRITKDSVLTTFAEFFIGESLVARSNLTLYEDTAEIYLCRGQFLVMPEYRGQGIGKEIAARTLLHARQLAEPFGLKLKYAVAYFEWSVDDELRWEGQQHFIMQHAARVFEELGFAKSLENDTLASLRNREDFGGYWARDFHNFCNEYEEKLTAKAVLSVTEDPSTPRPSSAGEGKGDSVSVSMQQRFEELAKIYGGKGAWYKILEERSEKLGINLLPSIYITIQQVWRTFFLSNKALLEEGNALISDDLQSSGTLSPETKSRLYWIIRHLKFSKELRAFIKDKAGKIKGANITRSSGRFEDSFVKNLAGIFISPAKRDERLIEQAVREIFQQALFVTWLHEKGKSAETDAEKEVFNSTLSDVPRIISEDTGIALLIQPFFEFDSAGTAFSNMYGKTSIEAVIGDAGTAVNSVHACTANYLFDKDKPKEFEYNPAFLDVPYEFRLKGKEYSVEENIDELRLVLKDYPKINGHFSPLSSEQAIELNRIINLLEQEIGTPVDVEWGFLDGKLYIIQVRPIIGESAKPLVLKDDGAFKSKQLIASTPIALGHTADNGFTGKVVVFGSVATDASITEFEKQNESPYIRIQLDVATKMLGKAQTSAKVLVDPVQGSRQAHNLANIHSRIFGGEFSYANGPILREDLLEHINFIPHPNLLGVWVSSEDVTYFCDGLRGEFYIDRPSSKDPVNLALNDKQEKLYMFHSRVRRIWHEPLDLIGEYQGYRKILIETIFRSAGVAADVIIVNSFMTSPPKDIVEAVKEEIKQGYYTLDNLNAVQLEMHLLEEALSFPLYPDARYSRLMSEMATILMYKDAGERITPEDLVVVKKPHNEFRAFMFDFHNTYHSIELYLQGKGHCLVERVDAFGKGKTSHDSWEEFVNHIEENNYDLDFLMVHLGGRDYAAEVTRLCGKVRKANPKALIIVEGRLPDGSIAGLANDGYIEFIYPVDFKPELVINQIEILYTEWAERNNGVIAEAGLLAEDNIGHHEQTFAARRSDEAPHPEPQMPEKLRILYLEDEEMRMALAERFFNFHLRGAEYDVRYALTAEQAIEILREGHIDLAFLDAAEFAGSSELKNLICDIDNITFHSRASGDTLMMIKDFWYIDRPFPEKAKLVGPGSDPLKALLAEAKNMRQQQLADFHNAHDEWGKQNNRQKEPSAQMQGDIFDKNSDKIPVDPGKPIMFVLTDSVDESQELAKLVYQHFPGQYNVIPMAHFMYIERMLDKRGLNPDIVITYDEMEVLGKDRRSSITVQAIDMCKRQNPDVKFIILSDDAEVINLAKYKPFVVSAVEKPFYYEDVIEAISQINRTSSSGLVLTLADAMASKQSQPLLPRQSTHTVSAQPVSLSQKTTLAIRQAA